MTPPHPGRGRILALAVLLLAATLPVLAQGVVDVFPMEPVNGGVMGPKGMFRVGYEGTDLGKSLFKIEMSRDDFETIDYTFDQQQESNGWAFTAYGGESGAIYRLRQPLPDGVYRWRVSAWNGIDWVRGQRTFTVTVDAVPPAAVEGIEMTVDRKNKSIRLSWSPVFTDKNGKPELVQRYHVYRYERRSFFWVVRPFEIGVVEDTMFEDRDEKAFSIPLLFYKVNAEDVAGNEPDRRY